jgi:hypothetical protein
MGERERVRRFGPFYDGDLEPLVLADEEGGAIGLWLERTGAGDAVVVAGVGIAAWGVLSTLVLRTTCTG